MQMYAGPPSRKLARWKGDARTNKPGGSSGGVSVDFSRYRAPREFRVRRRRAGGQEGALLRLAQRASRARAAGLEGETGAKGRCGRG